MHATQLALGSPKFDMPSVTLNTGRIEFKSCIVHKESLSTAKTMMRQLNESMSQNNIEHP